MSQEYTMRYSHRITRWKSAAAIGVAGVITGLITAGVVGGTLASAPLASLDITTAQPPPPGPQVASATLASASATLASASATLASVGVPAPQPPAVGPETVVITDPGGGDNGPKAVVISGGDPHEEGLEGVVR
jgi:hypothetical protein